jgi:hypothetical protein
MNRREVLNPNHKDEKMGKLGTYVKTFCFIVGALAK